jgi:hypothetical protein
MCKKMRGLALGAATMGAGAWADARAGTSLPAARDWLVVAFNLLVLGPCLHTAVARRWCVVARRWWRGVAEACAIVAVHAGVYHLVHRWMHERFFAAHAYHHTFRDVVPVSAANAVTPVEFLLAYMLPFVLACAALRPAAWSLDAAVATVSACNLAVHSHRLASWETWPRGLVPPRLHLNHHRRIKPSTYSAPTLWLDAVFR